MPRDPSAPLLIHIGYHKTGTTWLQRQLFRPEFGFNPLATHEEAYKHFIRPHGLTFDPQAACAFLDGRRNRGVSGSADVISSELLSGNPFFGGRESDIYAHRLKAIAPGARILITIREQLRIIVSVYMQYLHRGGTIPPRPFLTDDPMMGYFAFAPEHFDYHRLSRLYCELFGSDNVLVLTQESLAKGPRALAETVSSFAGVAQQGDLTNLVTAPESPSPPEAFAPLLRRINHFRSGPAGLGPFLDLGPVSAFAYRATAALGRTSFVRSTLRDARPITSEVRRRFEGRFNESNRELKALFGARIDLSGYPS